MSVADDYSISDVWWLCDSIGSKDGPLQIQSIDELSDLSLWSDVDAWRHVATVASANPLSVEHGVFVDICEEPLAVGELDRIVNASLGTPLRVVDVSV